MFTICLNEEKVVFCFIHTNMCSHLLLPKLDDHKSNCTLYRLGKCYVKLL